MSENFKNLKDYINKTPYIKKMLTSLLVYLGIMILYSNLSWETIRAKLPVFNTMFYSSKLSIRNYFVNTSKLDPSKEVADEDDEFLKVRILKIEMKEVAPSIASSGTIEPIEKVQIFSKVSGRIDQFFVEEGEPVKKGQPLLKIESLAYEIELSKQEASLEASKAKLRLTKEKYNESKKKIEIRLNEADKKISNLQKAKLEYERATEVYEKKKNLSENDAMTVEEFEQAKLDYKTKESAYDVAKRDFNIAMIGLRDEDIRAEGLEIPKEKSEKLKLLVDINTKIERSEVEVSQKDMEAMEANLRATKMMIQESTLYAPISGFVSERQKSTGVLVNSGSGGSSEQAIMSLVKFDKVYATFYINEFDSSSLSIGMEVNVKSDIFPGEDFRGKLKTINPEIDTKTHTNKVSVILENKDLRLKPGMFIRAEVVTGQNMKIILIPSAYIRPVEENLAEVYILKPDETFGKFIVSKIRVRPGKKYGEDIEIKEGLSEGDLIAIEHISRLRDGMAVKPIFE